ncbi:unnamed protein product [Phytophthora fragariaefolia]|uniref:Cyclin-dependent kinase 2 homolog n=1 Tax=Phytophthora fragariaefolia TaxID=1490495 RepID=A0A9W6Y4K4_9STRA|nr:unnamed protein product [Phytophthora fragariaefolia]
MERSTPRESPDSWIIIKPINALKCDSPLKRRKSHPLVVLNLKITQGDDKTFPVRSSSASPSHIRASRVPLDPLRDSDDDVAGDATLEISDFALVRATGILCRRYTTEVITLWYRAPEILMGVQDYGAAVDVWSIGCIFAEMAQGKPLFTGISEVDQLFQIFSKLSTPTTETWPGFSSLPNYHFEFPSWNQRPLTHLISGMSDLGIDLLAKLLTYDPGQRITAEEALCHPYFFDEIPTFLPVTMKNIMNQVCYIVSSIWSNPLPGHVQQFHEYLRQAELDSWKEIEYLRYRKNLETHAGLLLVVDVFEMCPRTFFLAVNYTDRYLNSITVEKSKLQLLGATSLHVASKLEDVSYIGVKDLAMCADSEFKAEEVLRMEENLLNTLNFTLSMPTALDFMNIYEKLIPSIPKKIVMLTHYLLELTLQEYQFLKYAPSIVATCCLSMAMRASTAVLEVSVELPGSSQEAPLESRSVPGRGHPPSSFVQHVVLAETADTKHSIPNAQASNLPTFGAPSAAVGTLAAMLPTSSKGSS